MCLVLTGGYATPPLYPLLPKAVEAVLRCIPRRRLREPPAHMKKHLSENRRPGRTSGAKAGVLIPLCNDEDGAAAVLFTKRTEVGGYFLVCARVCGVASCDRAHRQTC